MAIGVNSLTSGSDATDLTTYTTASISPSANALVLAFIESSSLTTAPTVTLSGAGMTWVEVLNVTEGPNLRRLTIFRAMNASPGSGAVTITMSGTSSSSGWSIFEMTGVDTSGTNGSGAIVQSATNSGSGGTGTVTLSAAANSNNRAVSDWHPRNNSGVTPRTNWTEIHESFHASPSGCVETQWRSDAFETTASGTWSVTNWVAAALEIAAASGTAYNASLADTAAATDALTRVYSDGRALADSAPATEAFTRAATTARALSDTAAATDASTRAVTSNRALADTASATEALTRATTATRALADSAPATEVLARAAALTRALADTAAATEAVTTLRGPARALADNAPATDALTRVAARTRALADSAPATDALTRAFTAARALADSAPATDALTRALVRARALADTAPATDALTRLVASARALADTAPAVDVLSRVYTPPSGAIVRSITDSAPAVDSIAWFRNFIGPTSADPEVTLADPLQQGTTADVDASETFASVP